MNKDKVAPSIWEKLFADAAVKAPPSRPIPLDPVTGLPLTPAASAVPAGPTNTERGMKSIRGAFGG